MKLNFTYDDEDRPIKRVLMRTYFEHPMTMEVSKDGVVCIKTIIDNLETDTAFSKEDFADFTALVNRINKQING